MQELQSLTYVISAFGCNPNTSGVSILGRVLIKYMYSSLFVTLGTG